MLFRSTTVLPHTIHETRHHARLLELLEVSVEATAEGGAQHRDNRAVRAFASINLIVTVLNMRAPGMSFMKMPVFTWMILVVQFLLVFSLPVITVALVLLMFQRSYGATFFDPSAGGDPLLWQHLFWIFGHPEVYVLILPAFGIISEVDRKSTRLNSSH